MLEDLLSFVVGAVGIVQDVLNASFCAHVLVLLLHYTLEFANELALVLLLMMPELIYQLLSVPLVDFSYSFGIILCCFLALQIWTDPNVISVLEPNCAMDVLGELASHP